MRYGSWLVLKDVERSPAGKSRVLARCKCGSEQIIQLGNLRSGRSTRCRSCAKKGRPSNRRTHGEALEKTVEWRTWRAIRNRCERSYNVSYDNYGGRGIRVCARWQGQNGYSNFLADMGRRPSPEYSIDRKNNDGPYSPENCRWATIVEQANNKRTNIWLTVDGRTQTLSEWAIETNVNYCTLWRRYRSGWSHIDVVTKPVRKLESQADW